MLTRRSLPAFPAVLAVAVLASACFLGDDPVNLDGEPGDPPLNGTIFIDPDILTPDDPTTFLQAAANGQADRTMYDRRVEAFVTVQAYLFDVTFDDALTAEIQVNPEFSQAEALIQANKFGEIIGRLPTVLRSDLRTIAIHLGEAPLGGGSNSLIIHTGQAEVYEADGILDEALFHEATHTSLDGSHANSSGWLAAQGEDPSAISGVAQEFPTIEDVAESFLPYVAVRYRSDRITDFLRSLIEGAIPARIAYFDAQGFNMYPIE